MANEDAAMGNPIMHILLPSAPLFITRIIHINKSLESVDNSVQGLSTQQGAEKAGPQKGAEKGEDEGTLSITDESAESNHDTQ